MVNVYSSYKAVHHPKRIQALKGYNLIYPTQVQIDLTNECNHHCLFCFYRYTEKSNNLYFIETERVLKLLDEFVELEIPAIHFTGGGEPFKHEGIYSILERAFLNNIEVALVTNGTLILPDEIDLVKKCIWIRISLDAATAHTYSITQGIDEEDFYKVIELVKVLVENKSPVIGLSFVVNPMNYTEIVDFVKLSKSLKVNNVRFSVACTPKGVDLYLGIWKKIEKLIGKAKEYQDNNFKVFDLITGRLENLDMSQREYTSCIYQHFTAVIGANKVLYPCCMLKYNPIASLGNIENKTFKEVWLGQERVKWLKSEYLKTVCDKNPCWMDAKNQFLGYLVEPSPKHINYI